MVILRGTKGECIRKMLELEETYGRIFRVISLDNFAHEYELHVSELHAHHFAS